MNKKNFYVNIRYISFNVSIQNQEQQLQSQLLSILKEAKSDRDINCEHDHVSKIFIFDEYILDKTQYSKLSSLVNLLNNENVALNRLNKSVINLCINRKYYTKLETSNTVLYH
ncbi:MAG: hypothetical protein ACI9CD_000023 [Candidatus Deianiraeaceae bacterium]